MERKRCVHGRAKGSCAQCSPCPHGRLKKNCAECKSARADPESSPEPEPEIKLEPEIKQELFTIRSYFGIGNEDEG